MSREIELSEVAQHNTAESCWFVIRGVVYDVTKFLEDHPGGDDVLKDKAGKDATQAFEDIGHSPEAEQQMEKYAIGKLKGGAQAKAAEKKSASKSSTGSKQAGETPLWQKIIVPAVLIVVAYGVSTYFASN